MIERLKSIFARSSSEKAGQSVPPAPEPEPKERQSSRLSFSPSPYVAAGYVTIALAFGVFGTWAYTAPLGAGVIASGTVSVESNRKVIQHLEGGIVTEILVDDGDVVEAGDVLIRLDETQARSNYAMLNMRLTVLRATEARLIAESTSADEIQFPEELGDTGSPIVEAAIKLQRTLFDDRQQTRDGQIAILESRKEQLEAGIVGLEQQLEAIGARIDSMDEEIERLTRGQEGGVVSANQLAQTNRVRLELEGEYGQITAEIAKLKQTIAETDLEIMQTKQEYVERASTELRDIRNELNEVRERTTVAKHVLDRTVITAPVGGMVQGVQVHTLNGVIRPAEPLMNIIPLDDDLVVSARVRPVDIDNVSVGQRAEVRFPAFSSRTTPLIMGTVEVVSQDVYDPEEQGQEPYYLARIRVAEADVPGNVRGRLLPGMPADVIILTGERTLVQYLLKPLSDSFQKGMREI